MSVILFFLSANWLHFSISAQVQGPFSEDFVRFLKEKAAANEFLLSSYAYYGTSGSFGGKINSSEKVIHEPVVFVHGNSDSALHYSSPYTTGWSSSIQYFKEKGYSNAELYAYTYGDRNISNSLRNRISCRNMVGLRRMLEAVIQYTGSSKIDVIAHSMGVSLVRKALQGGRLVLDEEVCDLGGALSSHVDTLIGISGANYGMCVCRDHSLEWEACSALDGYFPGNSCESGKSETCGEEVSSCSKPNYAKLLRIMNAGGKEANFIASLWSKDDEIISNNNWVYGRQTSLIRNSDLFHVYSNLTHFQTKDLTAADQYFLVTKHHLSRRQHKRYFNWHK